MSLINWKVELKCKWMSHCILSAVSTDNDVHTMIRSCSHFVSTRKSKTKKNCLANDLKDHCIGMTIKQKVRVNIREMSIYIISRIKICRC